MRFRLLPYFFLLLGMLSFDRALAQCVTCGDGSEGAFNATSNTTITGGLHQFTSFTIAAGVTVRVTGTAPLQIMATGAVDIQGTLDVSGLNGADGVTFTNGGAGAIGVAGGGNGGAGSFSASTGPIDGISASGTGAGGIGQGWSGGGGAGYALAGASSGGVGGFAGVAYGDPQITGNTSGSGGGGGSGGYNCGAGGGGAGGGFVSITSCVSITVSGTVNANGGNGGSDGTGNCGGGGGGSGGSIWLAASSVNISGTLTAAGGLGGGSTLIGAPYFGVGGAGSVGRIRIDTPNQTGSGTITPAVGHFGTYGSTLVLTGTGTNPTCAGLANGIGFCGVTGGTGPYTYSWSNGATGNPISGLPAGCYTVTVTDGAGCSVEDTICIVDPNPLIDSLQQVGATCHDACDGEAEVSASGGTPGYSFLWSHGDTSTHAMNLCAGIYTISITDANGCVTIDSVEVVEPAAISLVTSSTPTTGTSTNDGSASVSASGGTPGYTYLWTPGGGTTATISGIAQGSYLVTVTDSNGCSDTASVFVSMGTGLSMENEIRMELYPNPTHGHATLHVLLPAAEGVQVSVVDAQGRIVMQQKHAATTEMTLSLDLTSLADGIYQVRIDSPLGAATRRLTLQH